MTTHLPPKCPSCNTPLALVSETSHAAHQFNPETGCYHQLAGEGELYLECPECFADVWGVLRRAPSIFLPPLAHAGPQLVQ